MYDREAWKKGGRTHEREGQGYPISNWAGDGTEYKYDGIVLFVQLQSTGFSGLFLADHGTNTGKTLQGRASVASIIGRAKETVGVNCHTVTHFAVDVYSNRDCATDAETFLQTHAMHLVDPTGSAKRPC
jgi:hypothetical protein